MRTSSMYAIVLAISSAFAAYAIAQHAGSDSGAAISQREVVDRADPMNFKSSFKAMFGTCGNPCPMPKDLHGVNYARAVSAAIGLKFGEIPLVVVVINAVCRGECIVFADHARHHVCLGPNASFAFDRAVNSPPRDPPFSHDILRWGRGKKPEAHRLEKPVFPLARSMSDALTMDVNEAVALGFWKRCPASLIAQTYSN